MRSSDFKEFIEMLPPDRIQEPTPQQALKEYSPFHWITGGYPAFANMDFPIAFRCCSVSRPPDQVCQLPHSD